MSANLSVLVKKSPFLDKTLLRITQKDVKKMYQSYMKEDRQLQ